VAAADGRTGRAEGEEIGVDVDRGAEFERLREVVRRAGLEPFELTMIERVINELQDDMEFFGAVVAELEGFHYP
jgi:hypothetical protein